MHFSSSDLQLELKLVALLVFLIRMSLSCMLESLVTFIHLWIFAIIDKSSWISLGICTFTVEINSNEKHACNQSWCERTYNFLSVVEPQEGKV